MAKKKAPPAAAASPRRKLNTSREVAAHSGVAERTVATWVAEGLEVPTTVGQLEKWCEAHGKGRHRQAAGDEDTSELAKLQRRKLAAETELAELKAGEKKGQLLPVELVLSALLPFLSTCKLHLSQIPDRLLPYLQNPSEFRARAQREVDGALEQLADAAAELQQLVDGPPKPKDPA